MGNCQAIDAAALVIQHPNGRIERMYWSVTASEIMKINPGHYVSLIIPLSPSDHQQNHSHDENKNDDEENTRLITRVKLLRSTDTLVLGRAYRLITSQEVMKVLREKRHTKMKRNQRELEQQNFDDAESSSSNSDSNTQAREERQKQRTGSTQAAVTRTKSWRPSLNSISEVST